MKTDERTMLARLAFADPDKQNPLHDLGCQYLAQPEIALEIIALLDLEHGPRNHEEESSGRLERSVQTRRAELLGVSFDRPITKGSDQYRTCIGFIDLVLHLRLETKRTQVTKSRRYGQGLWSAPEGKFDRQMEESTGVAIEVKVAPVPTGDILRQINLYRSYTNRHWDDERKHWVVATAYPLSALDIQSLRNEGIIHVVLGQGFEEFAANQREPSFESNVEI